MTTDFVQSECDRWNEQDLIRRLCHALDIARLAVEHLAADGYKDGDPSKNVRPEKIVSETAVLLVAASPAMVHDEVDERVRNVAELLKPHARSERARLGLCLEPAVAWDYALPHVCLNRLDYPDYEFDKLLRESLESQARCGRERVPHRILEQEWVATGWYQPKPGRKLTSPPTARRSILAQSMDLLNCTRDDIYAFTHALMYVTDFNLIPALLPRRRALILAEAEALLARCLDEQDYDLAGEVLLSWPLTGKSWSAAAAFAFRVLARVEDKAGFLPTAGTRISEIRAREGHARTRYLLATAYHTAYVMGLLCAACLRPGHAPPIAISVAGWKPGNAAQIVRLLDADGECTHWRDEFRRLNEPERDALAGFLLSMALASTRKEARLRRSPRSPATRCRTGLADTPVAIQSAELLERLAVYAKLASESESEAVTGVFEDGVSLSTSV